MPPSLKIVAATAAFALLHSALASSTAKRWAAAAVGEQQARAFYRPVYVAQALATSVALAAYGAHLPRRTIYRLRGPAALTMRAGQAFSLLQIAAGIRAVGLARLIGLDSLQAWRSGAPVAEGPIAQGPERDPDSGNLRIRGPFLRSRHPLNFWAVPLFWCTPHLTTRRLAFNIAATLYLALGSRHEEARLRAAYGADYRRYVSSGLAFFVPRLGLPPSARRIAQPGRPD
jgi:protein-S-isoprenylcysteine O-methyltransferase Ste14